MALAFKRKPLKPFTLFPLRSEAACLQTRCLPCKDQTLFSHAGVERTWHILDSQGQNLALASGESHQHVPFSIGGPALGENEISGFRVQGPGFRVRVQGAWTGPPRGKSAPRVGIILMAGGDV